MTSPPTSARREDASSAWLQGWLVVGISFAALALAFSSRATIGLMTPAWSVAPGWSPTLISAGGAILLALTAVASAVGGHLIDKHGPRPVYVIGLAAFGIGVLLTAGAVAPWQFLLFFCVLGGIGSGALSMPLVSATVARFFDAHRGLATGIALAGGTGGMLVMMPLLTLSSEALGWRETYVAIGATMLATGVLAWFAIGTRRGGASPRVRRVEPDEPLPARLRRLFGNRHFLLLAGGFTLCGFTTTGTIDVHLVPYAATCGFGTLEAGTAIGVHGAFNMGGLILAGMLADRMHRPILLAGMYALRALTYLLLLYVAADVSLLFVFAAIFGTLNYGTLPVVANLVATHVGLRTMGLALGLLFAGHAFGAALGTYAAGHIFEAMARYDWAWIVMFLLALMAAALTLCIPETRDRARPSLAAATA